jgi:hypothetical protein
VPCLLALASPTATAGDFGSILHGLTAPVRALHREKPASCPDDEVERLAAEIDWLEHHIDTYGSIVAKHPDVWGQSRLTRHRAEYEEQLRAQLGGFQEINNASLRRSDQAFLGLALALGDSAQSGGSPKPAQASASVTNMISNPASDTSGVISRTPPFAATETPFATFGLDNANAIGLEPTIHLDHLSRYLSHLQELRRINEGDDVADSPGYALNLVRIPVSILPGKNTAVGHGAEITIIADMQLGDDLLPTTFRSLVVNDLVDLLAPPLTYAANIPAVRDECAMDGHAAGCTPTGTPAPAAGERTQPAAIPTGESPAAAAIRTMRARTVSVPSPKLRRARMPLPPEQLVDAIGEHQLVLLVRATVEALGTHPASSPCIDYADVRGLLAEELQAAYDFLSQDRQRHAWAELANWNLAELVRSRRANEIELHRRSFFASLGIDEAIPPDTVAGMPFEDGLPPDVGPGTLALPDAALQTPCGNHRSARRLCTTTTAVLAWAILVESALLDERLAEDIRESCAARGVAPGFSVGGPAGGSMAGGIAVCGRPFFGPDPSPEARAAFADYVRRRWPIRVFALDPVTQEQNVEEQFAQRREIQVAMAMAVASGRASGQALARYARRLEMDLATVSLNKTAVGFTHGPDSFGWRFYPRIQPPVTRGNLVALADALCGQPAHRDLADRRIEPGMRECTAIVVMPSFVPFVTLDVRTNWFSLAHPKATDQSLRQAMLLSRSVKSMQESAARCAACADAYRGGEVARLLRRVDQLDRELPLQTMLTQIPYENTSGGFELFNTGVTDLAPELVGWYGGPGVDPTAVTTLFLVGKGFSVHDTSVIAGGRPVKATLLSRQVLRAEIPAGVQTIRPALDGSCPPGSPTAGFRASRPANAHARNDIPRPRGVVLAAGTEPLPAPAATDGTATAPPARQSLRLSLPAAAATPSAGPACDCRLDCNAREVVDVHVATPYGVSGHLLIPVATPAADSGPCDLAFAAGNVIGLTTAPTKAGTWRVNEFFESAADEIVIRVPASFAPPARAAVQCLLRDDASGATAGQFSIPAPPFDARRNAYVLAGADLRNFIGDTSRPATDKTLRGALKPYIDAVAAGSPPDATPAVDRDLTLTAQLVTEQKTIPIDGAIAVQVRRSTLPTDDAAE